MNRKIGILFFIGVLVISGFVFVFSQGEKVEVYEVTHYNMTYIVNVDNLGPSVATDIPLKVALLKDWTPYQTVSSINVMPEPDEIINDVFGNQFALYSIESLNPNMAFNVTINVLFTSNSSDFTIKKSEIGVFSGQEEKFVLPSTYIESNDPLIRERARVILSESEFVSDYAWNVYSFVVENITYQQLPGEIGARQTLENFEGGSAELGNLFVALMRAGGIPARRISGWGNKFQIGEELKSPQFSHGWSEFYLPSYGWVPVDPTWGQGQKYDNFATSDGDHVVLTKGAGIHFFTRGAYNSPFGNAKLNTDYTVIVNDKIVENTSPKRRLVVFLIFISPIIFIIFLLWRIRKNFE